MPRKRHYLFRLLLIAPLFALAVGGAWIAPRLSLWLWHVSFIGGETLRQARESGIWSGGILVVCSAILSLIGGGIGSAAGIWQSRFGLAVYRSGAAVTTIAWLMFLAASFQLVSGVQEQFEGLLSEPSPAVFTEYGLVFGPACFSCGALVLSFVWSLRAKAVGVYTGAEPAEPALGDRILENIRSFGPDPHYRKSTFSSVGLHVFVLFILPWLLSLRGCVDPYYIPEGSGKPVVMLVSVVKPQKKKPREYILRPDSAIRFDIPDLDDTEIEREVLKESEREYQANPDAQFARLGQGGGTEGGWPDGMGRHPVRFIRLEYNGREWDDGMGSEGADIAFLRRFEDVTGFEAARQSESVRISQLDDFPKGFAPPFVYMTGDDRINVSTGDMKQLRAYLLDGGMLFADAGHRNWDRSFRSFIRRTLPDKRLVEIAHDDPIFRYPTAFPNGAPPVWAHGGQRCLGMKHKGRWIVFYHPGDLNDAWKGTSVSGLDKRKTDGAFEMGLNIIYYAFTHYLEETRKYRK